MVEVTLQMTEEELKELIAKEFNAVGKYANDDAELYIRYFNDIIDNGSATFFYGPVHLRTWIMETLDRTTIVTPTDPDYNTIKELWDSKEYESANAQYVVVANYMQNYLLEWY